MKREETDPFTYYCPVNYQCGCTVQMRLEFSKDTCAIYTNEEHTMESHKKNKSKYLSSAQKMHLEMVTRVKPQERPSVIRRGTRNLAEELHVGPEHVRSREFMSKKSQGNCGSEIEKSTFNWTQGNFFSFCSGQMYLQASFQAFGMWHQIRRSCLYQLSTW